MGKDDAGQSLYSREDVERYARDRSFVSTPTTTAARAFAMFEEGHSHVAIVKALGVQPASVRKLYQEYRTPLGAAPPASYEAIVKKRRDEAERTQKQIADEERARELEFQTRLTELDQTENERRARAEREHTQFMKERFS